MSVVRTGLRKWLIRLPFALFILALFCWLGGKWLIHTWAAKPPPLPVDTAVLRLKPELRDGRLWLGKSWAGEREGLPVVCLRGSAFERGFASGLLLEKRMHTLEDEFIQMIHGYVAEDWKINLLKTYVIYRNRHLSEFIPLEYRQEIFATTLGCSDSHPEIGAYYNRMLNYHAAHDISYMMIDNPLVSKAGCTSFGAWGPATQNGHLISGRNFDWEAAEVFSRDRVVVMCEPDDAIPFISLAWAGMAGVVSGMNRAGVSVTLNGAPSSLPGETATPVAIVARDILERAHNLAEAMAILRDAKVFVSTLWLVGSRADGKFIVVEKTPGITQVREAEGDWIICANHFKTAGLKEDSHNVSYLAEATSLTREARLKELLTGAHGDISPMRAAEILRDRKLPGGAFVGNGHRATLNALIATHSTVMDLTEGIFWAASPPNQLGKFVAFDVQNFTNEVPARQLPSDGTLASGEFEHARQAEASLAEGHRALRAGDAEKALKQAEKAESLNPGFYQNAALRGRAELALERREAAARDFEAALAGQPAFLKERQDLEGLLRKARGTR